MTASQTETPCHAKGISRLIREGGGKKKEKGHVMECAEQINQHVPASKMSCKMVTSHYY